MAALISSKRVTESFFQLITSLDHFFFTCNTFWFRKLRRVCSACLDADKRLKPQLVGSPPEMEEDSKSDVSEIQSQRTGSVLSGRDESETGAQDTADAPSDSQPGTYYKSLSFKTAILRTGCDTFLLILVLRNLWCSKDSSPS